MSLAPITMLDPDTATEHAAVAGLSKPKVPADAVPGTRVVRTRYMRSGQYRWFLGVEVTAANMDELAQRCGGRHLRTQETLTGIVTDEIETPDWETVHTGDWFLIVGPEYIAYTKRQMNADFTSVRGGVLSGR